MTLVASVPVASAASAPLGSYEYVAGHFCPSPFAFPRGLSYGTGYHGAGSITGPHLGVSIVPRSITQIVLPGVVYRPIRGPAPVARLSIATRQGRISQATRNFLALLPTAEKNGVAAPAAKRSEPR